MKLRRYVPASIALAVLLFLSSHTFAQGGVSFAQLNGTVQDTSGRALVWSAIRWTGAESGLPAADTTPFCAINLWSEP
jgi:hypothetical protein